MQCFTSQQHPAACSSQQWRAHPSASAAVGALSNHRTPRRAHRQQTGRRSELDLRLTSTCASSSSSVEPSLELAQDAQASQECSAAEVAPPRRLVVAVNDTEESWCAVKWTLNNIYRDGDVLHLVHCVPKNSVRVPLPAAFLTSINDSMDYEDMLEVHAYEFINSTMVEMASSKKAECRVDVLHVTGPRNAGDAVCKYSEDLQAGLVVIAAQPMGPIDEFFTGGCMSGRAIEQSKLPILILPPQIASMMR
uniref:UspA domain-containing protein n=1 Tax=Dunaliella tertiolecta TaxID=3047 RepID=A0A7S3R2G8_DUNTE|mmetsp:Transcript_23/g.61  ORF Transcript_23/g.61 Transcript_23/m.61 type:complete len:250 (+) Transcript_23:34-783(+)|eukprot:CAMPEP_0202368308 /NCGR_PEP_ID=MMETSP1127-20130417/445_1 /ASSEMBLY_ACC=CAM_ASM_000462 /TAXON_ID=3047 /ORGANISM="Dunaliella tertiolecta, Strain CCMP1320" /LENGTH=249 /DNA_ID=CAMNT_0048963713 /DNA_START=40 /DNA_END=789 /DNA_ORIENTATION=+